MMEWIEIIIFGMVIVWFVDHILFKGKNTTRFWIIFDVTIIFLWIITGILERFG